MTWPFAPSETAGLAIMLVSSVAMVLSPDRQVMVLHAVVLVSLGVGLGLVLPHAVARIGLAEVPPDE